MRILFGLLHADIATQLPYFKRRGHDRAARWEMNC
jgi:hypothetical protein